MVNENILKKINVILDDYGHRESNFEIIQTENEIEQNEAGENVVQIIITITYKESGKKKTYEVDEYSVWVSDFEHDLQDGYFE